MKYINILSLVQAFSTLKNESLSKFLKHYEINIKKNEVDDLNVLVDELFKSECNRNILDKFYVGYKIPQISKEFDLLKFSDKFAINIEVKKSSTKEKIEKQLKRNRYYLGAIGKSLKLFAFIADEKQLYYLKADNTLEKVNISILKQSLVDLYEYDIIKIDRLFNPSEYLVSPFNSTNKFIQNEYFLTDHQEEIKSAVLSSIKKSTADKFTSITGSAGTGKTLLVYDIAKELIKDKLNVLIIHCGYLNDGQEILKNEHSWKIIPIKQYSANVIANRDVIIIDETQRIYSKQIEEIVKLSISTKCKCIFSYDKTQTLSKLEIDRNIDNYINGINSIVTHKLTEKIRTNKEIASFIKCLFNNKKNLQLTCKDDIEINYFVNIEDASAYIESLCLGEWEVLRFTPSQYNNEHHEEYYPTSTKSSHKVIGQEFDNVAVVVDRFFYYNESGDLRYNAKTYYHAAKMLFQNITRTRKKLNIVIINNSEILDRCLSVL